MNEMILIAQGPEIYEIPQTEWQEKHLTGVLQGIEVSLGFMSGEHHLVRNFVVRELPRVGQSISPEFISHQLNIPVPRVNDILDELEKHLVFLFRNEQGSVTWAYPVTVASTPHLVTFSSGEKVYAACAIDAIALPYVQGQLRGVPLSTNTKTACAHCGQPLTLELDSDLNYQVLESGANPVVFEPIVNLDNLREPSIINAY